MVSVLYIVSISRHVYVCVCVCNIHTYMHTYMFYFLLIMLCKFVNKMYIKSHDMRKNIVSERGGGADKKKKKKKKKKDLSDSMALQNDLYTFAEWERTSGMEFHPQKCNVLRVSKGSFSNTVPLQT